MVEPGADRPFKKWCTAGGGVLSIPLVALGAVILIVVGALGVQIAKLVADRLGIGADHQALLIAFTLVSVLLALWLLEAPIFSYVTVGQAKRIQLIKGYFSPAVIVRYFDEFWSSRDGFRELIDQWKNSGRTIDAPLEDKLRAKFDELLQDDFGLRIYIVPTVLLTAIAGVVLFFGFQGGIALAQTYAQCPPGSATTCAPVGIRNSLGIKLDLVSIAAIFGAFTWVASDCITRNYQGALHPSDLGWYALRLVVAVPLGEAIAATSPTGGPVLAFVVSMFSFERISQILSSIAGKMGAPAGTPAERDDLVLKLPGVDEATANRLAAEGITTVSQMGAADPVRTSIRASQPFDFVLALIDAALLWNYVGNKLDTLRTYGFKGVTSLLAYHDYVLKHETPVDQQVDRYKAARAGVTAAQTAGDAALAVLDGAQDGFIRATNQHGEAETARIAAQNERTRDPAAQPKLDQATADKIAADTRLAAARKTLDDAQANVAARRAALDAANQDLSTARAALVGPGQVLADAAKKAGIDESALRNVIEQVVRDDYVDFIRHLMWVVPES
jgi:hypothetical protein